MFLAVGNAVEHNAAEKSWLARHFEQLAKLEETTTMCMWLFIALLVSTLGCCSPPMYMLCFGLQNTPPMMSYLSPCCRMSYSLCFGAAVGYLAVSGVMKKFLVGMAIDNWCMALCIWVLILFALCFCFLGCLLYFCFMNPNFPFPKTNEEKNEKASELVGKDPPDFEIEFLDGTKKFLKDIIAEGKPVAIDFYCNF